MKNCSVKYSKLHNLSDVCLCSVIIISITPTLKTNVATHDCHMCASNNFPHYHTMHMCLLMCSNHVSRFLLHACTGCTV